MVPKQWLVVIPARLESQRLPRKALLSIGGLPMIVRVAQNMMALEAHGAKVVVATDALEIVQRCQEFGLACEMTSKEHRSGTDRCYEVAQRYPSPLIVNVQGDEPFLRAEEILQMVNAFCQSGRDDIATLVNRSFNYEEFQLRSVVKALSDKSSRALYFSRAALPYGADRDYIEQNGFWHHQGVYLYLQKAMESFCRAPPSLYEQKESLEQLRALDIGLNIYLHQSQHSSKGIDTPEDLEAARALLGA